MAKPLPAGEVFHRSTTQTRVIDYSIDRNCSVGFDLQKFRAAGRVLIPVVARRSSDRPHLCGPGPLQHGPGTPRRRAALAAAAVAALAVAALASIRDPDRHLTPPLSHTPWGYITARVLEPYVNLRRIPGGSSGCRRPPPSTRLPSWPPDRHALRSWR